MQVNIHEAKARLSSLLEMAVPGEDVVIARAGKPVARLTPLRPARTKSGVRIGGLKGVRIGLSPDFHAPLSDEDLVGR